ncbi:MAG: HNH endonuclease [Candidatus Dormibacteraceae bacterium]
MAYVGITDWAWFSELRKLEGIDEVNFWQPSPHAFRALVPGEPFLFKLHSPRSRIVGVGFFARHVSLPVSIAWETFGLKNGTSSLLEMRSRVEKYRKVSSPTEDYEIGCILLEQPAFFEESDWIDAPDWKAPIQSGRGYRLDEEPGQSLWGYVQLLLAAQPAARVISVAEPVGSRYGPPVFTFPRLGQGSFQAAIIDAYARRCAITGERVLPVLEAGHIRPYSEGGEHRIDNGLLLRRDLHTLFDRGYLTVTPEMEVVVSKRLKNEFHNGKEYLQMSGHPLLTPARPSDRPNPEFLDWHNQHRFVA